MKMEQEKMSYVGNFQTAQKSVALGVITLVEGRGVIAEKKQKLLDIVIRRIRCQR